AIGPVSELVAIEVIDAQWDDDVLEDVEGRVEPLNKVVEEVVVRIGAIVKIGAKGGLPFLGLQDAVSVGLTGIEAEKVVFGDRAGFGAGRQMDLGEVGPQIGPVEKADLRAVVGLDGGMKINRLHQIAAIKGFEIIGPVLALKLRIKRQGFGEESG